MGYEKKYEKIMKSFKKLFIEYCGTENMLLKHEADINELFNRLREIEKIICKLSK